MSPTPDEFSQTIEGPWVDAPADSHLKAFRFVNRAFAGDGRPSELYVVFREKRSERTGKVYPESEYVYEEQDHQKLAVIHERMAIHLDPGEVVWSDLIRQGNKGRQVR